VNPRLFYIGDQALSSATTFLVLSSLSRHGDLDLVGRVALVQSVLLAAIGIGRALGVDVWASRGAAESEAGAALRASWSLYPLPLLAGLPVVLLSESSRVPILLFVLCTPLLLVNDSMRIYMMHIGRSLWSMCGQLLIVVSLIVPTIAALDPLWTISIFLGASCLVVTANSILCRAIPGRIDVSYARRYRERSIPFAIETTLGVVAQQVMFFLITAATSVSTAALFRLAQTTLGPLGILLTGVGPLVLRSFGLLAVKAPAEVLRRGAYVGSALSALLAVAVAGLLGVLSLQIEGTNVLTLVFGQVESILFYIIAVLGIAQVLGGMTLALGTAARVQGRTAEVNRLRILTIVAQAILLLTTAPLGSPLISAAALASNSVLVLAATTFVLVRREKRP
jgi:hypothetical protein